MPPDAGGAASPRRPAGPLAAAGSEAPVALAEGTELVGEYRGSGRTPAPFLIRRSDGRMLEVSQLLYLVASNLDGASALEDVAGRVGTVAGRSINAEGVSYLIEHKLAPLGVVHSGARPTPPPAPPAPVLALSIRAGVVPAGLVRNVAGLLRPLFLPPVMAAVLLSLVALDIRLVAGHDVGAAAGALVLQPGLLLMVVGLTLAAGLFHELGHATASRYGGAEPGAIGVGVYLLWPVFYNDLNDTYRLPRRGRLRADLGGVYFNAVFIVVLAAVHAATGFAPLLVAIAVQHVAIVQQFLPFVRLDGYYVVSDLAGVPDLFGHIRPTLARLVSRNRSVAGAPDLTRRARAIVTVWVVGTVPALVALTVLLLVKLPAFVAGAGSSLVVQASGTVAAVGDGEAVAALLGVLQMVVLAVPLAGLCGLLLRAAHRCAGVRPGQRSLLPDIRRRISSTSSR